MNFYWKVFLSLNNIGNMSSTELILEIKDYFTDKLLFF